MRKSVIDRKMITKAYELAKNGYNNKSIYEYFHISKALFYQNIDLMDSIKKGREELKTSVADSILKNAVDLHNPTVQIFLAKKLRLFDDTFDSITLKNSDNTIEMISKLFKAISEGSISEDKGKQLQSILETFNKAYEQNVLEERIKILEEKYETKR